MHGNLTPEQKVFRSLATALIARSWCHFDLDGCSAFGPAAIKHLNVLRVLVCQFVNHL